MEKLGFQKKDLNKIRHLIVFRKYAEKIEVSLENDKKACTLRYDQYTLLTISRSVLLRMANVSSKVCRENHNTHFVFSKFFPKILPFVR